MNYLLTIRVPFTDIDDVIARQKALEILEKVNISNEKVVKLQRLQENAEPVKVNL